MAAGDGATFTVFGYGSLVNRATLPPFLSARPMRLEGWRRGWRASGETDSGAGVCSLSARPAAGYACDGLAITFERAIWPVIRRREFRYDVVRLEDGTVVFQAERAIDRFGDDDHPLHLSYVDVVLKGFLIEFGAAGVARFMAETEGWHAPILDDRSAPRYPRAQQLEASERALVDKMLKTVDARIITADERRLT
jgi:hypothetical protein